MQAKIKIQNGKELQLQVLVDSRCIYIGIDKQLVKEEWIKTRLVEISFEVFNTDGIKNGEITRFVLLKVEINGYKEQIDIVVIDLNGTDMFLGYDWLVKHNLEVNWDKGTIQFTRYSKTCRTKHQDILFKTRRAQVMDTQDKGQQEIGKKPDLTNLEDLPEYIQLFIHLFNKKKFKKLLEQWKQDYEINLMEEVLKKLNAKAYAMTIKEDKALNQWLDKELKTGLIVESSSRYITPCFYIPKKDRSL